ncbi:unnamed protein product [Victoria cruziana]
MREGSDGYDSTDSVSCPQKCSYNTRRCEVLIFDECHRATGNHPYARMMLERGGVTGSAFASSAGVGRNMR